MQHVARERCKLHGKDYKLDPKPAACSTIAGPARSDNALRQTSDVKREITTA